MVVDFSKLPYIPDRMPLYPSFESLSLESILDEKTRNSIAPNELSVYMGIDLENCFYNDCGELVFVTPSKQCQTSIHEKCNPKPLEAEPVKTEKQIVPAPRQAELALPKFPGEIKQGIRKVILCKDLKGEVGVQLISVDKGVFVSLVRSGSPAALGGVHFGDQILAINGNPVAGMSGSKAMDYFRKGPVNGIEVILRDRPFGRTVVLSKDCTGGLGLKIDDGMITAIVKDSSAAKNGVLIHHQIVEVNGQNVMGIKDKHLIELLKHTPSPVSLTLIPYSIYKHMIRRLFRSEIAKHMDHSVPCV